MSGKTPRYQVKAPSVMARIPNPKIGWAGRSSPWQYRVYLQNTVLPDDVHPDDLKHLLSKRLQPARGGGPFIAEFPA